MSVDSLLVSVVMSVYNGEKYLKEAIESILSQTFRNFEFIVINDGSTDGTREILHAYEEIDSRMRVYHQDNRGLVSSLNRGCELARAKYLARMDADDIAFPDRLELQVNFLERNPDVALLGGAMVLIDEDGWSIHTQCYPTEDRQIKDMLLNANCFSHPTIVMRKVAFQSIGGYRQAFRGAEDYDLWLRMAERYKLANLAQPVLGYRIHPDQASLHQLRQQVFSTLAAQAAAKIRRKSGRDPTLQVWQITEEVLYDLGISNDTIQNNVFNYCLRWGNLMLRIGEEELALQLFQEALACSDSKYIGRTDVANAHKAHAKVYYHQGQILSGTRSLGKACLIDPIGGARLLIRKACRLLGGNRSFKA